MVVACIRRKHQIARAVHCGYKLSTVVVNVTLPSFECQVRSLRSDRITQLVYNLRVSKGHFHILTVVGVIRLHRPTHAVA